MDFYDGVMTYLRAQNDRIQHRYSVDGPLSGSVSWDAWRKDARRALQDTIDKNRPTETPDLAYETLWTRERPDHLLEKIVFTSEPGLVNPAYRITPAKPNGCLVVCVAGHGYGARDIIGLEPDDTERSTAPGYQKDFALSVAARGFSVIVPELLGFGDLRMPEDAKKAPGKSSCDRISVNLLMAGRTMMGVRVVQARRTLDLALSMGMAPKNRVGIMGISGGGLVTTFTCALDERFDVSVVSGYACTFRDSVMAVPHCVDNYANDLLSIGEMEDILALIAPRPMLWEAGDQDDIFPVEAVRETYAVLEKVYEAQDARSVLDIDIFQGEHQISGAKAYDFLEKFVP